LFLLVDKPTKKGVYNEEWKRRVQERSVKKEQGNSPGMA
jgi:hypothetical protein